MTNLDANRAKKVRLVAGGHAPAPGYQQVSDARLKTALKRHDGILSHAARSVGLSRQAVWERVQRNAELREFVRELETRVFDMVESNIIKACREGDGAMLRFFADRRMRARGYGFPIERDERTSPDPAAESRRREAVAALHRLIEERARAGLPPIFSRPGPKLPQPRLFSP